MRILRKQHFILISSIVYLLLFGIVFFSTKISPDLLIVMNYIDSILLIITFVAIAILMIRIVLRKVTKRQYMGLILGFATVIAGIIVRLIFVRESAERWSVALSQLRVVQLPLIDIFQSEFRGRGWVLIQKIVYLFTEPSIHNQFLINALLGSIVPVALFSLVYALTRNQGVSLLSAILIFFNPVFLNMSYSESYSATAIVFLIISISFFSQFLKNNDKEYLIASYLFLFVTPHIKPDYLLIVVILGTLSYLYRTQIKIVNKWFLLTLGSLVPFMVAYIDFYHGQRLQPGMEVILFSENIFISYLYSYIASFQTHFIDNLLINFAAAGVFVGALMIISLFSNRANIKKMVFFAISYFLIFVIGYSVFTPGATMASNIRYVASSVPFSILAGVGIYTLSKAFKLTFKMQSLLQIILSLLVVASFIPMIALETLTTIEPDLSQEYDFLMKNEYVLSKDCAWIQFGENILLPFTIPSAKDWLLISDIVYLESAVENANCLFATVENDQIETLTNDIRRIGYNIRDKERIVIPPGEHRSFERPRDRTVAIYLREN